MQTAQNRAQIDVRVPARVVGLAPAGSRVLRDFRKPLLRMHARNPPAGGLRPLSGPGLKPIEGGSAAERPPPPWSAWCAGGWIADPPSRRSSRPPGVRTHPDRSHGNRRTLPARSARRSPAIVANCGASLPQVCHLRSAKTADCWMRGLRCAPRGSASHIAMICRKRKVWTPSGSPASRAAPRVQWASRPAGPARSHPGGAPAPHLRIPGGHTCSDNTVQRVLFILFTGNCPIGHA